METCKEQPADCSHGYISWFECIHLLRFKIKNDIFQINLHNHRINQIKLWKTKIHIYTRWSMKSIMYQLWKISRSKTTWFIFTHLWWNCRVWSVVWLIMRKGAAPSWYSENLIVAECSDRFTSTIIPPTCGKGTNHSLNITISFNRFLNWIT